MGRTPDIKLSTRPYKGTRDFYPEDQKIQKWMFQTLRRVVEGYGYGEYDGPMLEPFELYAAKTGEEIVNRQLYWLMDQGERKLAVRPEMTPTLARMVAGKLNELPQPIRWYSIPNLWRYERPQKGRLREHWQLNVDVLGGEPALADAEILCLALDLMDAFGGRDLVQVKVNHRGIVDYFFKERLHLSADVALQVVKALDGRAKMGEEAYAELLRSAGVSAEQSAQMEEFFALGFDQVCAKYACEGTKALQALFTHLKESGVEKEVVYDPMIMRGMDYYTGTVFEIYDTSPENNRAMFGGGRYDNLIGLFGKQQLPGVGFGMGDVTLRNFLETHGLLPTLPSGVDVFISLPQDRHRMQGEKIARTLRAAGLRVVTPLTVGNFGKQLKQADRLGARYAVLFGDEEEAQGKVILKDLAKGEQRAVTPDEIAGQLVPSFKMLS